MEDQSNTADQEVSSEKIDQILTKLEANPLIASVLAELAHRLPSNLKYHDLEHTRDVLREAVLFSIIDGLSDSEVELLAIAAAYHDAGYIEATEDNELIGAEMARRAMTQAGKFSEEEIRVVEAMILDTRLIQTSSGPRQMATTELSKYLLDADLNNLGSPNFFERGEALRTELGAEKEPFMFRTMQLLKSHHWHTEPALRLRQQQKEKNFRQLRMLIDKRRSTPQNEQLIERDHSRIEFLAHLPLLLNSSLDSKEIIERALEHLKIRLEAEAATVFLLSSEGVELTFWALKGGSDSKLEGRKMPAGKGIVGWVIKNQESVLVPDVQKDPRFFSEIDKEAGFSTRNLICTPLMVRGRARLGAIQVLNKRGTGTFSSNDLKFVEQMSHQIALAIDNARLYEELSVRNRQLEIIDKRRDEMISMIAHEFRTPLNVIINSADVLCSGYVQDVNGIKKMQEALNNGVDRIGKLINGINEVSFVSADKLQVNRSRVIVSKLFDHLQKTFAHPIASRKQSLLLDHDLNIEKVDADEVLLFIVLRNLVANAIRFSCDGKPIRMGVRKVAGQAEFFIEDQGIGIDKLHIPAIFEKFYEVADSMNHHSGDFEFCSGGLGLGLAAVKAILDAHAVQIHVQSELDKGSKFYFSLPMA